MKTPESHGARVRILGVLVGIGVLLAGCVQEPREDPVQAAARELARGNLRAAIDLLQPAAAAGDFTAQALIGRAQLRLGAYDEGVYWLSRASVAGDQVALLTLADIYLEGLRVPRDFVIAARYYRRAVAAKGQGYGDKVLGYGYARLGFMTLNGFGLRPSLPQGLRHLREASTLGNSLGMLGTGMAHEYGVGLARDQQRADVWFDLAISAGSTDQARRQIESTVAAMRRARQDRAQFRAAGTGLADAASPARQGMVIRSVGMGAILNWQGAVLTSYGDVADCEAIRLNGTTDARLFASDPDLNVALLSVVWSPAGTVNLRRRWAIRPNEEAVVAMFPPDRLLAAGPVMVAGQATEEPLGARQGGFDFTVDTTIGGGGGLVIDDNGHLAGLITEWISIGVADEPGGGRGDAVARAVDAESIGAFLDLNRVRYRSEPYQLTPPPDAARETVGQATALVECWDKLPARITRPPPSQ